MERVQSEPREVDTLVSQVCNQWDHLIWKYLPSVLTDYREKQVSISITNAYWNSVEISETTQEDNKTIIGSSVPTTIS